MQATIRCPVLLADAVERIERHGGLLGSPLFLLRNGTRVAAILRMTLCDGLRVLSWMSERSIREYSITQSVPTLFVLLLNHRRICLSVSPNPCHPNTISCEIERLYLRLRESECLGPAYREFKREGDLLEALINSLEQIYRHLLT
jgi:hypothetical protein